MGDRSDLILAERLRLEREYRRREMEVRSDLYSPWQPAEILLRSGRKRVAAMLLHRAGVFPRTDDQCLEIGYGSLGWLGDLITWGVKESSLHGIELNASRARQAQELLSVADLRVGDATLLPWSDGSFRLVIASTVFTSVLETNVRRMLADEIYRVLEPGGALLWYDFSVNNPRNPHVKKVDRQELMGLFPRLGGEVRSVTLAPPLARWLAPRSWTLASVAEAIPALRTHLLAVLVKGPGERI